MLPPPIKTPTHSSMRNRGGTRSAVTPLTLLPITSILSSATATTAAGTEYVRIYLAITISIRVNIVRKRVTNIVKDVWAIDR